jgi:predicted porin
MKKTLIALAALAATASFAQVTLSGRIALGLGSYSATGATAGAAADAAARTKVDEYSSRLKFAVNEDLGGGMRAFGVYEFGLNFDTGTGNGQAGTANTASAFNGSRESHIGIGNSTMEVRVGRQNVYWTQGDLSEQGANFVGKDSISDMYTRVIGGNVRQNNTILLNLNSTSFAGSQLYWATEVSSESAPVSSPTAAQSNANGSVVGFKLNWDQGAWHAMADYNKRSNVSADVAGVFPALNSTFDATSIKLGLGYRYAERSIVAIHYWDMKKEFTDAATNNTATVQAVAGVTGGSINGGNKQTGWALNVTHNLGNGLLGYASYGVLNNMSGTGTNADLNDSGTTAYSIGIRKELSKRTALFANYGQINNAAAGTYAPTGGSFVPVTVQPGADPTYYGVGMMHNF